ncbi:Papain family cysteine protease [compost metagenome]
MLKRPVAAILAAATLTATLLSGCGVNQLAAPQQQAGAFEAAGKKKAVATKFGLGANLKGAPKVKFDEGGEAEGMTIQAALPAKVDLRGQCPPVYNQGPMGACSGFAIAKGLGEFILKKQNRHVELSGLYLYYQERKMEGSINEDAGARISDGMKVLDNLGCAPEKDHPYLPMSKWSDADALKEYLTMKPGNDDVAAGKSYRIAGTQPINSLRAIRNSLAKGMPVVLGIAIFESFQSEAAAKTGVIPMPNVEKEEMMGGHAVVCVGYDNTKKVLIMRNSWGKEWGDKGYFYLPYGFIQQGLAADAWTAKI